MLPIDPSSAVERLLELQREIRALIVRSRRVDGLATARRDTAADTIYEIDTLVEPLLDDFCRAWSRTVPLVLIAEGIEGPDGREGIKVFPEGWSDERAVVRLIIDPIDGTRGLMYDKRAAWALAGIAPNKGPGTTLRDIEAAAMTELPTSKMGLADVLWAVRGGGGGARGMRVDLSSLASEPLRLKPSNATAIDHGFATVSNFFPGTKVLAAELMEYISYAMLGPADVTRATVFDDQYISTGGQFYELIVGHDRFNADLRPLFYAMQQQPAGLCCHPYDCATMLVAEEAGVCLSDAAGRPLDGPLDVTTGMAWVGYANNALRRSIEPLLRQWIADQRTDIEPANP
jgi:hypothetical protein